MKIALVADIHANLPAFRSVLLHAKTHDAEAIWFAGDSLGYGAFPDEVVTELRTNKAVCIVGNYDLKVLRFKRKKKKWRNSKHPMKYLAFKWAFEQLSRENRRYLKTLPEEVRLQVENWEVLLTHGSPASNKEPLAPSTPGFRLLELAQIAKADLVICGHSHQPFVRKVSEVWFVNPGSVGRPDDGDPRACYAILQLTQGEIFVDHFRVPYDLQKTVVAIRAYGLPEAFAQMAILGLNLDAVEERHKQREQPDGLTSIAE